MQAGTLPQTDLGKYLKLTNTARVTQIIDPLTIGLEDGRLIRLTGIEYPDFPAAGGEAGPGPVSLMAMTVLKDLLQGKNVKIYQTKNKSLGRTNRMGHLLAHLETETDAVWVQGTLVSLGLAKVMTAKANPEMALPLYTLERGARKEKLGLWQAPQILRPEDTPEHLHSFQIVEGKITGTALRKNRLYLNFGPDWKRDFTVSIAPEDKRVFEKQGLDPTQWVGETVRVRGWIESFNGPYIEIDHPERFELPPNIAPDIQKSKSAKVNTLPDATSEPKVSAGPNR